MKGQLGAMRGLPGTLHAGHHDHDRVGSRQLERTVLPAERGLKLVADDLDHLLGGRQRSHHLVGEGPAPHPSEEVVCHLQRDVRLEQRRAEVLQGRVHLLGVELAPRAELAENGIEAIGERVEHSDLPWYGARMLATTAIVRTTERGPGGPEEGSGCTRRSASPWSRPEGWSSAWSECGGSPSSSRSISSRRRTPAHLRGRRTP